MSALNVATIIISGIALLLSLIALTLAARAAHARRALVERERIEREARLAASLADAELRIHIASNELTRLLLRRTESGAGSAPSSCARGHADRSSESTPATDRPARS